MTDALQIRINSRLMIFLLAKLPKKMRSNTSSRVTEARIGSLMNSSSRACLAR